MKIQTFFILLGLFLVGIGCSTKPTLQKRPPDIVASCFSDGEDQEHICKAQYVDEYSRVVVTRCIGSQNRQANAGLRGKCAEKTCSEGSNTDCTVRGEFAVLQEYADLVTSQQFVDEDMAEGPKKLSQEKSSKSPKRRVSKKGKAPEAEIDVDPSVRLPQEPEKKVPAAVSARAVKRQEPSQKTPEPAEMNVILKRDPASPVARNPSSVPEDGFKRVCVPKSDKGAPAVLRGKCATRKCSKGRCVYRGRKEMFDWVSRRSPYPESARSK